MEACENATVAIFCGLFQSIFQTQYYCNNFGTGLYSLYRGYCLYTQPKDMISYHIHQIVFAFIFSVLKQDLT